MSKVRKRQKNKTKGDKKLLKSKQGDTETMKQENKIYKMKLYDEVPDERFEVKDGYILFTVTESKGKFTVTSNEVKLNFTKVVKDIPGIKYFRSIRIDFSHGVTRKWANSYEYSDKTIGQSGLRSLFSSKKGPSVDKEALAAEKAKLKELIKSGQIEW